MPRSVRELHVTGRGSGSGEEGAGEARLVMWREEEHAASGRGEMGGGELGAALDVSA
jgi:hypothetical protein